MVSFATPLKIVVEEFARRLQTPYPVISDLFLEDSAHAFSSEIRRHRFRTSVDMKRNHIANNWPEHYVWIVVCAKCAFYLTLRVCRSK